MKAKGNVKRGISLITLVITIIVVIILAAAVILTLNNNNPVENAKEATFRSDVASINEQLNLYALNELAKNDGTFDITGMNGKVSDYVPGVTQYDSELKVEQGKLVYTGSDTKRSQIVEEIIGKTSTVEVGGLKYNKPNLSYLPSATTKVVKWDASNVETEMEITAADKDSSWYDYAQKKWANIYTNNNGNKAYWVWIPRYAYKIDNPHTTTAEKINIKFLSGTSNVASDGSSIEGYTIHPAFTFGDTQLSGIWVAKYEASSSDSNKVDSSGANFGGGNTTALQVRVLPDVYSWRNIHTGNMQTVSMNMTSSNGSVGTSTNIDTHQMKNIEWGAVAYLCQSQYGQEPWNNPYGDWTAGSYKLKTGYAGASKDSGGLVEGNANLAKYNTTKGVKASTTGNITGVYDMSGGAYEYVASVLNNGNTYIGTYMKAEHVQSNKVKTEYVKYYDVYEPGDEEKEGGAYYGQGGVNLWNSGNAESQNIIRKRLAAATYANFASKKGDALWETSNGNSYYGKYTSGTEDWAWLQDTSRDSASGSQYTRGWNADYMLVGYASLPCLLRGSHFGVGSYAGVFAATSTYGGSDVSFGFRPVLAVGLAL
ncbi:MAG: hypothetical protein PHP54_05215 [Clostridia bacterium]|nr:hypothetical protein [Clostridia bacterium]